MGSAVSDKRWRKEHPEQMRTLHAGYREKNRQKLRDANRDYRAKNGHAIAVKARQRKRKRLGLPSVNVPIEQRLEFLRQWVKNKDEARLQAVIAKRLRERVRLTVKNSNGSKIAPSSLHLLGCTWNVLKSHIESLFKPGMTWENRHLWHIDHEKPVAAFDLRDPAQQRTCFHYSNLRPLWAKENLSKGARAASSDAFSA